MSHKPFIHFVNCLFIAAAFFLLPVSASEAPKNWADWANWVDAQHSVSDGQGHGPDIGSDEWTAALGRKLGVIDSDGHGPNLKSEEWKAAIERKLTAGKPEAVKKPAKGERKLLSSHDTEATFAGISERQCRGRTALCPDRCGDSGKVATFTIVKYIDYQKPGKYGDPKQEKFTLLIVDNMKNPKIPAEMLKAIQALKPGDPVRLSWNHDYVSREGSHFPERSIIDLKPLDKLPSKE